MKPMNQRKRMVLRIRRRSNRLGLTLRERDILAEGKLFRTIRKMFPQTTEWQARTVVRALAFKKSLQQNRSVR